ncbi:hypothetical protein EJ08DRAFT_691070 [Tothia fuscella]|uniref:Uncharacterized protein n=1 Tax=Tothia fuscella TaxID=1048955 RepID=A0A9P4U553_9PEZI|nr:hypothetical protein EJ08DRAFT_691070 [Tothia fuscella]
MSETKDASDSNTEVSPSKRTPASTPASCIAKRQDFNPLKSTNITPPSQPSKPAETQNISSVPVVSPNEQTLKQDREQRRAEHRANILAIVAEDKAKRAFPEFKARIDAYRARKNPDSGTRSNIEDYWPHMESYHE